MAREDSSRRRADGRGRVVTGPLSNAATDDQSPQRCIHFFDCPCQIEFALVDVTMAGAAVRLPTKSPSRVLTQGGLACRDAEQSPSPTKVGKAAQPLNETPCQGLDIPLNHFFFRSWLRANGSHYVTCESVGLPSSKRHDDRMVDPTH